MSAVSQRMLPVVLCAAAIGFACGAAAQSIQTYTENPGGAGTRALGFPVPEPVSSLDAVDGFRDYASLDARLQSLALSSEDLAAHEVGQTQGHGRTVWAYVVSDADDGDVDGFAEAAFLVNAGTHAREWGTQEISTWLVEHMVAGADDGFVLRFLLDNTRLVIIPVHNIDGFLQAQRYPTRVVVGSDPRVPSDWPRDGRMRRKNMRGVDEQLETFADHLQGVDLNRNHPPFWAETSSSSSNPAELVYHGSGEHSEAENQALVQASLLAPPDRVRLGIDVHSFSQVFFSANTGSTRLNNIQQQLLQRIADNHFIASRIGGTGGSRYRNIPDPPLTGIGAAADWFAYEFLVPSWTLEIEPNGISCGFSTCGAEQYGGTADSHGGFILPASEVRRVREAWAESHVVGFYIMAGAPHLARVRVVPAAGGGPVFDRAWQRQGDGRVAVEAASGALVPGQRYRAELVFSKPMRNRSTLTGAGIAFRGLSVPPLPTISLEGAGGSIALDVGDGDWDDEGQRYARDRFVFEFDAPAVAGEYRLVVDTVDMAGTALDANPATAVDWAQGAWTGWENADGGAGDLGGADATTVLSVADDPVVVLTAPGAVGEGDVLRLTLDRPSPSPSTVLVQRCNAVQSPMGCDALVAGEYAEWAAGEGGERSLAIRVPDDATPGSPASFDVVLSRFDQGQAGAVLAELEIVVLDDDADGVARRRVGDGASLLALMEAQAPGESLELRLDPGEVYLGGRCDGPLLQGATRLRAGRATLQLVEAAECPAFRLAPGATLAIEDANLSLAGGRLADGGALQMRRSLVSGAGAAAIQGEGPSLERVRFATPVANGGALVRVTGGEARLHATSVDDAGPEALPQQDAGAAASLVDVDAGTLDIQRSTLVALGEGQLARGAGAVATGSLLEAQAAGRCASLGSGGHNRLPAGGCGSVQPSDALGGEGLGAFVEAFGSWLPGEAALDRGGSCDGVDLRGAPRPQGAGDGAAACDAGAIEAGVNPYRGLWLPDRPGHGLDLHTAGNVLFLTWYTYREDGTPASYLAAAPLAGATWRATLSTASGEPGDFATSEVGEIELVFASDTEATLRWRFGEDASWGEEGLTAFAFVPEEPRLESSGTWFDPTDAGWGLTVTRRGNITGLVLYFFDADGELRWALGQGGGDDVVDVSLLGYTGFCPDCDAAQAPPVSRPVGSMRLQFLSMDRARAWIDVENGEGSRFQRQGSFVFPANDPVDNRPVLDGPGR